MNVLREITGNREIIEHRANEYKEGKERPEFDYNNAITEQKSIIESLQLESLRVFNNQAIRDSLLKESFTMKNKELEGKRHPETDVIFEKKIVKDADGNDIEGVFPVFDSKFDVQLPEDMYKDTDAQQEKECNRKLKEAVKNDPELAKQFTPEQLEQIENGETPDGYTWHHNEETGKMQLVDTEIHSKTGHTGGRAIWGGGKENR
jgi:hypothetical protein